MAETRNNVIQFRRKTWDLLVAAIRAYDIDEIVKWHKELELEKTSNQSPASPPSQDAPAEWTEKGRSKWGTGSFSASPERSEDSRQTLVDQSSPSPTCAFCESLDRQFAHLKQANTGAWQFRNETGHWATCPHRSVASASIPQQDKK
jgi:hypothetical protein